LTRLDFAEKSAEQRHSEDIGRVIAAIDAAGSPLSANAIAQSLRGRRRTRLATLKSFVAYGWLERDASGKYRVADAGRKVVPETGDRYRGGNQGHQSSGRKSPPNDVASDRQSGHQRSPGSPVRVRKVTRK
jgi:hypothetical protein